MYNSLREEIERLHAEITITEQKLGAAGGEACKQHDNLLCGLLTTGQLLQRSMKEQLEGTIQKSETALAWVELAAQELVGQSHLDAPTDTPRQNLAAATS